MEYSVRCKRCGARWTYPGLAIRKYLSSCGKCPSPVFDKEEILKKREELYRLWMNA